MYFYALMTVIVLSITTSNYSWAGDNPIPDYQFSRKGYVPLYPVWEIEEGTRVTNAIPTNLKKNFTGTVMRDFNDGSVEVRWDGDESQFSTWNKMYLSPAVSFMDGLKSNDFVETKICSKENKKHKGKIREIFENGRVSLVVDGYSRPSLDWHVTQLVKDSMKGVPSSCSLNLEERIRIALEKRRVLLDKRRVFLPADEWKQSEKYLAYLNHELKELVNLLVESQ